MNPYTETPEQLVRDLWWFIENVTDDTPDRNDRFFALRGRVREMADPNFYCLACGREESACSANPCQAVIADREATI